MAQFVVIGLGRFGFAACLELKRLGNKVIGVDSRERVVNQVVEHIDYATSLDATDETALRQLDITRSKAVLVAIGENLEASILCVLSLKNLGVEQIWVKASSEAHHTILSRLGVTRVIHPEEEMGIKVAQTLNYPMVNQYMQLGHGFYMVEVIVNKLSCGQSLATLLKRAKGEIKAVLVQRGKACYSNPAESFLINEDDKVILNGQLKALNSIAQKLGA
ncbi:MULTISPECIES: potassium channel family protein [Pseudoalteromonas]|uniref:TrkA family potassium uptake protein n=1 Tax=Pseudoalteromonas piscicida TaxID=43662 RepID=A0AAD0RKC6_PSEO7|nr:MULTISPECIES: TrkA family potassium uptake protein [Pseudoalteromonas]ASD69109.1 potassium transporter TrkA [Pseudoalteromonas piscicida]AXQ99715.1 TrkA family potassium uptake protein [Pseudoalteromonas piscicida]AXR04527.1 TrkA family potassium uptake protein [Pseudoalteromonas piscicida]